MKLVSVRKEDVEQLFRAVMVSAAGTASKRYARVALLAIFGFNSASRLRYSEHETLPIGYAA